jgi:hypothetical protein
LNRSGYIGYLNAPALQLHIILALELFYPLLLDIQRWHTIQRTLGVANLWLYLTERPDPSLLDDLRTKTLRLA